jgi:hypothetical protein
MRRFLAKALLYCVVLGAITAAALTRGTRGRVDNFHPKFTHAARSLVIGSSRAAQGIDPSLLPGATPFLNFAFTATNSPYGLVYLRAIRRKVPPDTRDGLFLLEVNPTLLSIDSRQEREDERHFRENDLTLDRQLIFNLDPNFDYLLRNFREPLYRLFSPTRADTPERSHPNGWLEIRLNDDADARATRQRAGLRGYTDVFARYRWSPLRVQSLREIVAMLRPHGRVVLVRLPVAVGMAELEAEYRPTFDAELAALAVAEGAEYLNFTGDSARYETTDSNHLTRESARRCTRAIAKRLRHGL